MFSCRGLGVLGHIKTTSNKPQTSAELTRDPGPGTRPADGNKDSPGYKEVNPAQFYKTPQFSSK